jgi:parvulin-like peptidyl-prolyl isomerase
VNNLQVADDYDQRNEKAAFNFVAKRYDSEPDSLYPVSDEELRRYYDAHKGEKKYEQKASRSFQFVRFAVTATESDIAEAQKELAEIMPAFQASKGKADSAFVAAYADTKNAVAAPYTEGSADKLNDSLITHADTGAVVGPFRSGDTWKLVKVKELADIAEARVRHILLSTQGGKPEDEVKQRADSILAVVKRDKGRFEEMVKKYSEDPGSVQNGGVYEWFDKTRMVPEFTAASFDQKVGATTVCKTSYGFHIVEVLGQRARKERRVLTVDRRTARHVQGCVQARQRLQPARHRHRQLPHLGHGAGTHHYTGAGLACRPEVRSGSSGPQQRGGVGEPCRTRWQAQPSGGKWRGLCGVPAPVHQAGRCARDGGCA